MDHQIFEDRIEQEDDFGKARTNAAFRYFGYQVISSDVSGPKVTLIYCTSPSNSITTSTQSSDHLVPASPSYQGEPNLALSCDNSAPFNQQHVQQDIREESQNFKKEGCRNMPFTLPVSPPLRDSIKTKSYQIAPSSQEIYQYNQERLLEACESSQNSMEVTATKFHMKNKLFAFLLFVISVLLAGLGSKQGKIYKKKGTEAFSRAQELTLSLFQDVFSHERALQLKEYLETVHNKLFKDEKSKAIKKIALALAENLDFGLLVCCWLEELLHPEEFYGVMIFSYWIQGCRMSAENKVGLKCRKQELRNEVAEIRRYLSVCSHQLDLIQGDGEKAKFLKLIKLETDNFSRLFNFILQKDAIFQKIVTKIAKELEEEKNKKIKVYWG